MSVLQKIYNTSMRALCELDKKAEKNLKKMAQRRNAARDGKDTRTQIGGGLSFIFGPATWCALTEALAAEALERVCHAAVCKAKKNGHPLDLSP